MPDPVVDLWKRGTLTRLEVPALDRPDAAILIEAVLGGPIDGAGERLMWDHSGGNPLYLHEMLAGALDAGLLEERRGLWRFNTDGVASPRLADLVEARMRGLDAPAQRLVVTLAVGGALPEQVVGEVADLASLPDLEAAGLVQVIVDDRRRHLALAHPLHQEVLRESVTASERHDIERRLVEAIRATGARRREDAVKVALLSLGGGGDVDPDLATEAARRMAVLHDDVLAERLAGLAIRSGAGITAQMIRGSALARLGRVEEAEEALAAVAVEGEADSVIVGHTVSRTDNLFWALGRPEEAIRTVKEALASVQDRAWRAELAANGAVYSFMSGDLASAIEVFDSDLYDADGRAAVTAAMSLAPTLAVAGRADEAVEVAERALRVRAELDEPARLTEEPMLRMALAFALQAAGRLEEAGAAAQSGYDRAVATHDLHGEAWCAMIAGRVAVDRGQLRSAARWLAEGAVKFEDVGLVGLQRACIVGRALTLAHLGDSRLRPAAFAEEYERLDGSGLPALEPEARRVAAWLDILDGDLDAGRAGLTDAADLGCHARRRERRGGRPPRPPATGSALRTWSTDCTRWPTGSRVPSSPPVPPTRRPTETPQPSKRPPPDSRPSTPG